ncbi:hypothetical protein O181_028320 [Austropuccinia psidii MF-1]|uniref:DUF7872 domain-containing protein n=1 Tax=Austropuccinia psidii MF-1 TaxID=1389203 RepID=A0A9Q3H429_9BASI|nr:hypothetical protein [Austropuccinia psidii MF-1]
MVNDFLVSDDLKEHQVHALATLLVTVVGIGVIGLGAGLLGPALFPGLGVATTAEVTEGAGAEVLSGVKPPLSPTLRKRHLASPVEKLPDKNTIFQSDATLRSQLMRLSTAKRGESETEKLGETLEQLQKVQNFILDDSAWAAFLRHVLAGDEKSVNQIKERIFRDQHAFDGEGSGLQKRSTAHSVRRDRFYTWTIINSYLSSFSDHVKAFFAVTTKVAARAPISSQKGMQGMIDWGISLPPNAQFPLWQDISREDIRLRTLASVLRSMVSYSFHSDPINIFVTIGSDKCNGKGANGARGGKDRLSYCSPDGLMMNLIRASGKKSVNKIVNAHLITEKYGYTVEFLAKSAWSCRQEYGLKIEGKQIPNGLKAEIKVGCAFELPVCDTRVPEVANLRRHGKTVVTACRRGLALDI